MGVELIRVAEYARRRGVSAQAVHRAVKAGRIKLINNRIDPDVADIQWEANTRKAVGRGGNGISMQQGEHSGAREQEKPAFDYDRSRAKREHHEAALSEARAKREIGQLVETSRVRAAVAAIAGIVGDHLDRLPDRIAGQVTPTMTQAEIYARVEVEMDAARADLLAAVAELPSALNLKSADPA